MSVAGVVLAAGRSERMGAPKALLDFRGRPFVIRILEALEALDLKPRVVVLGPDAPRIRPALAAHECLIVENLDVAGGPIGVHVKVDTGMHRVGVAAADALGLVGGVVDAGLELEGFWTHFAKSEDLDDPFTEVQLGRRSCRAPQLRRAPRTPGHLGSAPVPGA